MPDGSEERRPQGREHEAAPEEQGRTQEELERTALASGGDAAAAGSVEQREAVARDEDALFDPDQEDG